MKCCLDTKIVERGEILTSKKQRDRIMFKVYKDCFNKVNMTIMILTMYIRAFSKFSTASPNLLAFR